MKLSNVNKDFSSKSQTEEDSSKLVRPRPRYKYQEKDELGYASLPLEKKFFNLNTLLLSSNGFESKKHPLSLKSFDYSKVPKLYESPDQGGLGNPLSSLKSNVNTKMPLAKNSKIKFPPNSNRPIEIKNKNICKFLNLNVNNKSLDYKQELLKKILILKGIKNKKKSDFLWKNLRKNGSLLSKKTKKLKKMKTNNLIDMSTEKENFPGKEDPGKSKRSSINSTKLFRNQNLQHKQNQITFLNGHLNLKKIRGKYPNDEVPIDDRELKIFTCLKNSLFFQSGNQKKRFLQVTKSGVGHNAEGPRVIRLDKFIKQRTNLIGKGSVSDLLSQIIFLRDLIQPILDLHVNMKENKQEKLKSGLLANLKEAINGIDTRTKTS